MLIFSGSSPTSAQTNQCDVVDIINYPIDTTVFRLVQDFDSASPRHQGRRHTGEDWFGGDGTSLGQPVRAAASGRVTYSSPTGWGRDGGVIILEHTLPDASIIYTQYGHITESDTVKFPSRLSCVRAGDIIGVIADARPAPHLHFEVRVNQPDVPGPGYTEQNLQAAGWRRPSKMVAAVQTQLHRAYEWHVTTNTYGPQTAPLVLNTGEMMLLDGGLLRRISWDGRVLWRVTLQRPTAAIIGSESTPLVFYADGTVRHFDYEGTPGEEWSIEFQPAKRLPNLGGSLMFYTADGALIALTPDRRDILWRLDNVAPFIHAEVSGSLIALASANEVTLISHQGEIIGSAELRDGADLAAMPDGRMLVYSYGGLWAVDSSGSWTEAIENAPHGGGSGAVAVTSDGRIYLMDGTTLHAYTADGLPAWQASLPMPITGRTSMFHYGHVLLITSTHGNIIALRDSGGICGFASMYGDDLADMWYDLGSDGTLRIAIGDQIVGFDWERLTNSC